MQGKAVSVIILIGMVFIIFNGVALADVYTTSNGKIYHNGNAIKLYGVNWFGFETQDYVVHGLWSKSYQEMISQMKVLGFNAVRLPFCPTTLQNVDIPPDLIDFSKNPDLVGLKSLEVMDKVIGELNRQHMYILLDHHRPDCINISELWYTDIYPEGQWINDLISVVDRYRDTDYFLGIDLKNEPHGAATWGTGNLNTDWNLAVERASQAILAINLDTLIFVEGIQENPVCSSTINHWWGGNLEPQQCFPINILSTKLVFSPHVYGPDEYNQPYFNDPDFPNNMPFIWDTHFGYLVDQDHTIAIGEFGGQYGHVCEADQEADPRGVIWENAIVDYFINKHICNTFYWSWNANSTNTCGILQDDWTNIWQDKFANLKRLMDACNNPYTDIKANASDGPINITSDDNLSVTIELDSSIHSGEDADWWVAVNTPFVSPDDWYHYDLNLGWISGISATYQGSLFDLPLPFEVLNTPGLPIGAYTFYFGVDTMINGIIDFDQLYYDRVEVNIE